MSRAISVTAESERAWHAGNVRRRYRVVLEDNDLVQHTHISNPVVVAPADDGTATAATMLQSFKDAELGPVDKSPIWNDTQADYDRRSLGRAMLILDVDEFISYLPLWQAMELRSGNNNGQRSAALGVSIDNYTLMDSRFGVAVGIQGGVATMNAEAFAELPAEFE